MPLTVWVPAIAVSINVGTIAYNLGTNTRNLTGFGWFMLVVGVPIGCLILLGLFRAHRLAWQWGTVIGGITAFLTAAFAFFALKDPGKQDVSLGDVWSVISPWLIFVPLLTRSATRYFGLRCPKCGSGKVRAGDFFFSSAKCRKCGYVF
ncbi:MAG: hypothetical protein WBE26_18220 [Phycisphaerae bacterium]